jgi:hypothetical protein
METRIRVPENEAFPYGVYAFASAEVEMARDFDKLSKDNPVQKIDKQTGLRVWNFEVLDADPNARGEDAVSASRSCRIWRRRCRPCQKGRVSCSGVREPDGHPRTSTPSAAESAITTVRTGAAASSRGRRERPASRRRKPTSTARPRNEKQEGS